MSKSADEQATEILVAVLSSEKIASYLGAQPDNMGESISKVWRVVYDTIEKAQRL